MHGLRTVENIATEPHFSILLQIFFNLELLEGIKYQFKTIIMVCTKVMGDLENWVWTSKFSWTYDSKWDIIGLRISPGKEF